MKFIFLMEALNGRIANTVDIYTAESSRPEQRIISHVGFGWVKLELLFLIHHERSLEQQIKDNTC